jgi:hypothetical protein
MQMAGEGTDNEVQNTADVRVASSSIFFSWNKQVGGKQDATMAILRRIRGSESHWQGSLAEFNALLIIATGNRVSSALSG